MAETRSRRTYTAEERELWRIRYAELGSVNRVAVEVGATNGAVWRAVRDPATGTRPRGKRRKLSENGRTTVTQIKPVADDEIEIERAPLPARVPPGDKKPYRVRLLVSLGVQAHDMEEALSIARGYNGVVEVLSIVRRG